MLRLICESKFYILYFIFYIFGFIYALLVLYLFRLKLLT
ncbi:protein of unknown function [Xenorhabdus bovienii]|uniref:Uncharacterized protein n=1 Tax=Xenorhabdus bovienii TaxID=40576 RepID=A0A0B6X5B4_XENBV|nr:protein of unknown function [Xenorhabdus bovienii]